MFCAKGTSGHPCPGNVGSPLISRTEGKRLLEGVVSGVQGGCSDSDLPDIYARISFVRDWIRRKTRI